MFDLNALRQQYAAKVAEAKGLAAQYKDKEVPQEIADKINGILGETDVLKTRIETAQKLEKAVAFGEQPAELPVTTGWREAGPNEGNVEFDSKGWNEIDVEVGGRVVKHRVFYPVATTKKGYDVAFEAYLRHGISAVKDRYPTDYKTLSEGTDTAGGFLVPPDTLNLMIRRQAGLVAVRPNARVITTGRDIVQFPRRVWNTDNIWTSGVRVTWTGETPASATAHRVTDPVYGQINIPVHVAMASLPLTNSLLEDQAYDVNGDALMSLTEGFVLGEDTAFVNGTGVAQPMGLFTQVDVANIGISSVATGSATAVTADGLISLYYTVPAQYRANGKWIMNSNTMKLVEQLKDTQNRYLIQSLINGSLQNPQFEIIKGKPVMIDEFTPDVGSGNFPVLFGDLNGYIIVDRVGFSVQRLTELYAETDITLLIGRKRVGGYPVEPWKLRVNKCA